MYVYVQHATARLTYRSCMFRCVCLYMIYFGLDQCTHACHANRSTCDPCSNDNNTNKNTHSHCMECSGGDGCLPYARSFDCYVLLNRRYRCRYCRRRHRCYLLRYVMYVLYVFFMPCECAVFHIFYVSTAL